MGCRHVRYRRRAAPRRAAPTSPRCAACRTRWPPRGPDGDGAVDRARRRPRPPPAEHHRPLRARRAADGRPAPRPRRRLQRHHLQPPRAARASSRRPATRFFSTSDTEVILKAYAEWGERCVERFKGMFAFCVVERDSGRVVPRPRPARRQAALPRRGRRRRCASPPPCPRCWPAAASTPTIDPVALHHYLSFHSVVPAPRTILAGRAQAAAGDDADDRAGRARGASAATGEPPSSATRSAPAGASDDWAEAVHDALRVAVERRMVSDVPGRRPALGRPGLEPDRRAARRVRPDRAGHVLRRLRRRRRPRGQRVPRSPTSWRSASAPTTASFLVEEDRMLEALDAAIGAMSEPMVSHDCVAFHLLSEEVAAAPQGRPVRPGRRRGVRRLLLVPAAGRGADGDGAAVYTRALRRPPARGDGRGAGGAVPGASATTSARVRRRATSRAPGAATRRSTAALRIDAEVMLVDDPVKRVDNMTMAHGLEARTPFLDHDLVELAARLPARAQARRGRQGDPQGGRARRRPRRGDRPPEGLLPRARALPPRGRRARAGARGADAPAARPRPVRPGAVESMLADPNGQRTTLDGSKLWQVGAAGALAPGARRLTVVATGVRRHTGI